MANDDFAAWPLEIDHNAGRWQEMTVSQIETLAKAGVKIDLQCPVRVLADPLPEHPRVNQFGSPDHLLDLIAKRWEMAMHAKYNHDNLTPPVMYQNPLVAACKQGDIVYVFVRGGKDTPPHVIEDPVNIFPSDALLAKLHLLVEFGK